MIYQDADGRIRGCGVGEDGMLPQQVRGGETCIGMIVFIVAILDFSDKL